MTRHKHILLLKLTKALKLTQRIAGTRMPRGPPFPCANPGLSTTTMNTTTAAAAATTTTTTAAATTTTTTTTCTVQEADLGHRTGKREMLHAWQVR